MIFYDTKKQPYQLIAANPHRVRLDDMKGGTIDMASSLFSIIFGHQFIPDCEFEYQQGTKAQHPQRRHL